MERRDKDVYCGSCIRTTQETPHHLSVGFNRAQVCLLSLYYSQDVNIQMRGQCIKQVRLLLIILKGVACWVHFAILVNSIIGLSALLIYFCWSVKVQVCPYVAMFLNGNYFQTDNFSFGEINHCFDRRVRLHAHSDWIVKETTSGQNAIPCMERGVHSQLHNWMHSSETCLPHLTQPLWIREVQRAALIDIHIFGARGTVGQLPWSGAECQIFTLSSWGFYTATFRLLAQSSYLQGIWAAVVCSISCEIHPTCYVFVCTQSPD